MGFPEWKVSISDVRRDVRVQCFTRSRRGIGSCPDNFEVGKKRDLKPLHFIEIR